MASSSFHCLGIPRTTEAWEERLLGEGTPEHFSGALVSQGGLRRTLGMKQILTKNDPGTLLVPQAPPFVPGSSFA